MSDAVGTWQGTVTMPASPPSSSLADLAPRRSGVCWTANFARYDLSSALRSADPLPIPQRHLLTATPMTARSFATSKATNGDLVSR